MGVIVRAKLFLGMLAFAATFIVAATSESLAQRTKFESLRQCERHAAIQFRKRIPGFWHFMIDRSNVYEDRFAEKVGTQFVSTIFYGRAIYNGTSGQRFVRFICLHPGYGKQPVFVYMFPD